MEVHSCPIPDIENCTREGRACDSLRPPRVKVEIPILLFLICDAVLVCQENAVQQSVMALLAAVCNHSDQAKTCGRGLCALDPTYILVVE